MQLLVGAVLSAVLLLLSAPGIDMGLLGFVAYVPFMYVLLGKKYDSRKLMYILFAFGFVSSFVVLFWIKNVAYLGLFLMSFYFAMWFVLSGYFTFFIYNRTNISFALVFAVVFTLSEYLKGVLFSGFPWFLAAWTQYGIPQNIQLASLGGVYMVSFLVLLVNGFICEFLFEFFVRKNKAYVYLFFAVLLITVNAVYGSLCIKNYDALVDKGVFKIYAVQGNVYPSLFWNPAYSEAKFAKYADMTEGVFDTGCDMLVWPEGAIDGELRYLEENYEYVRDTAVSLKKPFFVQSNDMLFDGEKSSYYNSVFLFSEKGELADFYYKNHLVPFGEYTPLRRYISWMRKFVPIPENFTAGTEIKNFSVPFLQDKIKIAPLICFEDIFPKHVRKFAGADTDMMLNVTNDGWFKKSYAPFQHMALASFRAVENRLPLARVTNTGITCVVDGAGRVVSLLKNKKGKSLCVDASGILNVPLKDKKERTFYNRNGDIFAFSVMFMFLIFVILGLKNKSSAEV